MCTFEAVQGITSGMRLPRSQCHLHYLLVIYIALDNLLCFSLSPSFLSGTMGMTVALP